MPRHMVSPCRRIPSLAGDLYRVQIIAVHGVWLIDGRSDPVHLGEPLVISRGMGPAGSNPTVEVARLHAQHGCLDVVETAVPTWLRAKVTASLAVVPESRQAFGNLFTVSKDHPRIAECAQIFAGVEARPPAGAECSQLVS